jgi:3-hydroxyisobutyrate dehydrogenase-like beta-hydroxyacid dehydrogenase
MEVGFIGLGRMGRPMVERLLAAGHAVHAFNRSPAVVQELAGKGVHPAASASEVSSRSEIVLTALPSIETVLSVYKELAESARPGQVFADHSTVSIGVNLQCGEMLKARHADFLDAPVSGGPGGAASGTLTVMVGGESSVFDRVLPVFMAFGKNVRLCGPTGAGQAVKLVNQLLVGIHTAAIAEAAVLGMKLGADPSIVLDLIGTSFGGSAMMARNLPRFVSRDFSGATPVSLILKDLGIIHDEAKRCGVPVLLGGLTEQRFLEAQARGWGLDDMASLVKLWEEAAGTTVHGVE